MAMNDDEMTNRNIKNEDALWTKKDAARFFRITTRCLENWMADGRVPFFKIGRTVRFRLSDILEHIKH